MSRGKLPGTWRNWSASGRVALLALGVGCGTVGPAASPSTSPAHGPALARVRSELARNPLLRRRVFVPRSQGRVAAWVEASLTDREELTVGLAMRRLLGLLDALQCHVADAYAAALGRTSAPDPVVCVVVLDGRGACIGPSPVMPSAILREVLVVAVGAGPSEILAPRFLDGGDAPAIVGLAAGRVVSALSGARVPSAAAGRTDWFDHGLRSHLASVRGPPAESDRGVGWRFGEAAPERIEALLRWRRGEGGPRDPAAPPSVAAMVRCATLAQRRALQFGVGGSASTPARAWAADQGYWDLAASFVRFLHVGAAGRHWSRLLAHARWEWDRRPCEASAATTDDAATAFGRAFAGVDLEALDREFWDWVERGGI